MAYLDNTVITVDAVLTKLGRERLSEGTFKITKWAVSDDEVDYSLYNTAHPLGTDYYSNIIESMPILEAIPDESQALRFKLRSGEIPDLLPELKINGTVPIGYRNEFPGHLHFELCRDKTFGGLRRTYLGTVNTKATSVDGGFPYEIFESETNTLTVGTPEPCADCD